MSVFKRITSLLTPPPTDAFPKSETVDTPTPTPTIDRSELKGLLKRILLADSHDDERIRGYLSQLKEIAQRFGGYVTASEIQNYLVGLPLQAHEDRVYRKARGYELAGDLYLQNAYKRSRAVAEKNVPMGPNEFKGYCTEVLSCLFLGEKHLKGVEAVLGLSEELMLRAVLGAPEKRSVLAALALRALDCTGEAVVEQLEKDERTHNRKRRLDRRGDSDSDLEDDPVSGIDSRLVPFLTDTRQHMSEVFKVLETVESAPIIDFGERTEDRAIAKSQLVYLAELIETVKPREHLPLIANLADQASALQDLLQPGSGQNLRLAATHALETRADEEAKVGLLRSAGRRYRRAYDLSGALGDETATTRLKQKLTHIGRH